jgi:hypothetical protein
MQNNEVNWKTILAATVGGFIAGLIWYFILPLLQKKKTG